LNLSVINIETLEDLRIQLKSKYPQVYSHIIKYPGDGGGQFAVEGRMNRKPQGWNYQAFVDHCLSQEGISQDFF